MMDHYRYSWCIYVLLKYSFLDLVTTRTYVYVYKFVQSYYVTLYCINCTRSRPFQAGLDTEAWIYLWIFVLTLYLLYRDEAISGWFRHRSVNLCNIIVSIYGSLYLYCINCTRRGTFQADLDIVTWIYAI